jgi:FKBP-type peptidyl-prolyl cis-trans isomerase
MTVLLGAVGLAVVLGSSDPCVSGTNVTLDDKTYLTRYVIETAAPAGSATVMTKDQKVTADVLLTLEATGAVVWNSSGPFAYNFNATPRGLIVGFDVGSYGMMVGETRKLCIPYEEGYGPAGKPPTIPGGATLLFELKCLSVGPVQ